MKTLSLILAALALAAVPLAAEEQPLKSGDQIRIDIKGVPLDERQQVEGHYTVSDDGMINLYLIGEVVALGEKPSTLAAKIQYTYINRGFYTDPTVVISTEAQAAEGSITVVGGLRKNGVIAYRPGMTLADVITIAGGFSNWARVKEVRLTREGKTIVQNCENLANGPNRMEVRPGDTIMVPQWGKRF